MLYIKNYKVTKIHTSKICVPVTGVKLSCPSVSEDAVDFRPPHKANLSNYLLNLMVQLLRQTLKNFVVRAFTDTIRADICHSRVRTSLRTSDANVFVIFPGARASSRCSKELGERLFKHARLKVSTVSPPRIISTRLLAALYTPLMSYTMPSHAWKRATFVRPVLRAEERAAV